MGKDYREPMVKRDRKQPQPDAAARPPKPIGRRPGTSGARERIAEVARRQFGERGYDRATIRSIAAEADVDPALITHYFRTKQALFTEVIKPPADPATIRASIAAGPAHERGTRFARAVLEAINDPNYGPSLTALLRTAANDPQTATRLGQRFSRDVLAPLAGELDIDRAAVRAALAATQIIGLVMAREVMKIDSIVQLDDDELIALLAPTLQRYLAEPLDTTHDRIEQP